jgi:hypothetical protein
LLEDVEAGSLRVWLKNILLRTDDEAIKDFDWKKQVGKYVVKAKYIVLEYLDDKDASLPRLEHMKRALQKLAEETDVRHLPDYPPINEKDLIAALDKLQAAKKELEKGDRLTIDLAGDEYTVNLDSTWLPSDVVKPTKHDDSIKESDVDMSLIIRKPDLLKDAMWQFVHGKANISAPLKDEEWLEKFHRREIPILPGDALHCKVHITYCYDEKGYLTDQKMEITKVYKVIPQGGGVQGALPI